MNENIYTTTITGNIEKFIYFDPKTEYCVLRMHDKDTRGVTTAKGHLPPHIPAGTTMRFTGRWITDKKYGEQFEFDLYEVVLPDSLNGLESYLASGLIKGIGPSTAKRIVAKFGTDTAQILEHEPDRLSEVDGIGAKKLVVIKQAWAQQRDVQSIMIFLQGIGVSSSYATRIYKTYGKDAIAKVKFNPYSLADDVWGIGFRTADRIARQVGISDDSPLRVQAGILYCLSEATGPGHCYLPIEELLDKTAKMLDINRDFVMAAIPELAVEKRVVIEAGSRIFLAHLHAAETGIAKRISDILSTLPLLPEIDIDEATAKAERDLGIIFADAQKAAIKSAIDNKISIITGGPGTGKSTLLKGLLMILKEKKLSIALAAPTGRAAKRMTEITKEDAKTIHRLLEYDPSTGGFMKNADSQLLIDVLIIDEAGMPDVMISYALLKATSHATTVVYIGDVDQLPPVGSGNVLKDMISSGIIPVTRLTHIFRQGAGSLISTNAQLINQGKWLDLQPGLKGEKDFYCIFRDTQEEILAEIISLVKTRLPAAYKFNPFKDITVLSCMHKGTIGTVNLNAVLQENLNHSGKVLTKGSRVFRLNDKIMQLRNNYEKGVYNGDMGVVIGADEENQTIMVDYDGLIVEYDQMNLDELALAYSSTIHKAQGGEYPVVIIPIHTAHYIMLARTLLYTAVTRGKRLVVLVGQKKAIAMCIKNNKASQRYTTLSQKLTDMTAIDQNIISVFRGHAA